MPGTPATSPRRRLTRYGGGDAPSGPAQINSVIDAIDNDVRGFAGTEAARDQFAPPGGWLENDFWFSTDTGTVFRRNSGGSFDPLNPRDSAAAVASLRSLGSGPQQAAPGDVAVPPVGALNDWAGAGDPAGGKWLLCDGRALARVGLYAALYAAIGTTYGAGDASTTFNIPDLRGRSAVGADNMGTAAGAANRLTANSTRGAGAGEERHALTSLESGVNQNGFATTGGAHGHAITVFGSGNIFNSWQAPVHDSSWGAVQGSFTIQPPGPFVVPVAQNTVNVSYHDGSHGHSASASADGGHTHGLAVRNADQSHNNMQPYLAVNVIIRAI